MRGRWNTVHLRQFGMNRIDLALAKETEGTSLEGKRSDSSAATRGKGMEKEHDRIRRSISHTHRTPRPVTQEPKLLCQYDPQYSTH